MKLHDPQYMTTDYWFGKRGGSVTKYIADDCVHLSSQGIRIEFPVSAGADGQRIVAAHGSLRTTQSGHNDPDWREDIFRRLGVVCQPASKLAGKLFCPHTGARIAVGRVLDNPIMWCDVEHGIALSSRHGITYTSPDAAPTHAEALPIQYSFHNATKLRRTAPRIQELLREAKVREAIMYVPHSPGVKLAYVINLCVAHEDAGDIATLSQYFDEIPSLSKDPLVALYDVCRALTRWESTGDSSEVLAYACATKYEADQVIFRP